ncbi:MAG: flavin reductase family protein [Candidatus Micrarchaeota archaeon]|nr:flavin reductase family protein [Candidatus Micrarchaeota archaeon]
MEGYYHLLYPMRVVLISASDGKSDNVMTAAWCMPLSFDPPMFGVAISKKRFTWQLIEKSRAFAINLVSAEMKGQAIICGTKSGKDTDKFKLAGLKKEKGKLTVIVGDAPASIECKVVESVEAGDHVLFVGEAVSVVERRKAKGLYHFGGSTFSEI